ncbi:MAG: sensor histidine kinase [Chitinophagales bacterium]
MNPQTDILEDMLKRKDNLSAAEMDSIIRIIESQNRELKIEASLEKVRVAALAMKEPADMMEICFIINEQLVQLDFKEIRNVQTAIFKVEKGTYINYEFYRLHDKKLITEVDYKEHPMQTAFAEKMIKGPTEVFTNFLSGAALRAWYEHQKTTNQYIDTHLEIASSLNYYWYSLGPVALGISTYSPLSNEERELFLRFRNVFGLAYRRYLDIENAISQAKEAQIELALEKVRARSMAMQKSDEVMDVAFTMYEEVQKLDFKYGAVTIVIMDKDTGDMEHWVAGFDQIRFPESLHIPYFRHPCHDAELDAWKKGEKWLVYKLTGEEKKSYDEFCFKKTKYKDFPETEKKRMQELDTAYFSLAFTKHGALHWATSLLSEEQANILQRFAKVFEQSYTRFLDLQKAEAQARDAQIEAALERIRSRTMAMQRSDELQEAANLLFRQIQALDIPVWSCGYNVYEKDDDVCIGWMSSEGLIQPSFKIPLKERPVFLHFLESRKKGERFYVEEMSGENLAAHYKYMLSLPDFAVIHENFIKAGFTLPTYQINHVINFAYGNMIFITSVPVPESWDIFQRFANVFEQTYTRFLDLQRAEDQAREARIELALERVRASTMAMHKSEDLSDTAAILFRQLSELGDAPDRISIGIINEIAGTCDMWATDQSGSQISKPFTGNLDERTTIRKLADAWKAGMKSTIVELRGNELQEWVQYIRNHGFTINEEHFNDRRVHNVAFFSHGWLNIHANEPLPPGALLVLERFAGVFSQTYRRFLDLQTAETQAREARIEAALEKVRASTMAMHRSEELSDTAAVLFKQLSELGDVPDRISIGIIDEKMGLYHMWLTDQFGSQIYERYTGNIDERTTIRKLYKAWKAGEKSIIVDLEGNELREWLQHVRGIGLTVRDEHFNNRRIHNVAFFSHGWLNISTVAPLPKETLNVLERFAAVYSQTYRRFLDLQKAEAQAREARIEAALERVRSKAMSMQKSEDLAEAVAIVFDELDKLEMGTIRCGISIINKENRTTEIWSTLRSGESTLLQVSGDESMDTHPLLQGAYDAWTRQEDFSYHLKGEDLQVFYRALSTTNFRLPAGEEGKTNPENPEQFLYVFHFPAGGLYAFRETPFSEEAKIVIRRFATVFHLTYTRFRDLQQAEAQAREAKIEAALERVRSKAMAMHNSEDLASTVVISYKELSNLSSIPRRWGIGLMDKASKMAEITSMNTNAEGETIEVIGNLLFEGHSVLDGIYDHWLLQKEFQAILRGKELSEYYQLLRPKMPYPDYSKDDAQFGYFFPFHDGVVYSWTEKELIEDELKMYRRFTSVISLTYKRYKDIKLAEEQAREATIEAAMEKVRGRAMAMHNTQDLSSTASMIFSELRKLGINPIRFGVGLFVRESRNAKLYTATSSPEGETLALIGWVFLSGNPVHEMIYESWLKNEEYFPELEGESLRLYYENLSSGLSVPSIPEDRSGLKQYGSFIPISVGILYTWSEKPYTEQELKIFRRFATIIDLTFRRYIELQKSEANALVAVRQASIDRVRAEIASMRKTKDLDRITPLIWNELVALNVPFIRCGVFIMDDTQQLIHTFLSTPDGKAIAAFHLPYSTTSSIGQTVRHWRERTLYVDHWDEAAYTAFADTLVKQGALNSREQYLSAMPKGGFYLHFLPFLQGMLYVANTDHLRDDDIKLIQSVADAFSTAYSRYEDFNSLELAKEQVEKTLTDLKQAQTQLVQSEKMASLGELTAGIAHEIQNPLNFVNNFSDVSTELLDEMKMELKKGHPEGAMALADDVIVNLQKISHHGKRADAIVKGMLQHSRSSTGQKEEININQLADEYLRLAYHGLRAKDKSFNAVFKTDFDQRIGEIELMPQEFGRVLVNLISNAFYAVNEKKKQEIPGYEPTVTISTKKLPGKIELRVIDNGNGIPSKLLDKIFQPFFTTKPTGQGTGLGLSLSYDIITKGHGGEMKVETREGEGSEFVIWLPIQRDIQKQK